MTAALERASLDLQVHEPDSHIYLGTVVLEDGLHNGTYALHRAGQEPLQIVLRKLSYTDPPNIALGAEIGPIRVGDTVYCAHPFDHVRRSCWANGKIVRGFNARGSALLDGEPSHKTSLLRHLGERNRRGDEEAV